MEEKLASCPFCGAPAFIEMIRARNWMARCGRACDVNKYGKTKATTAAAWNTRIKDPAIEQCVEALAALVDGEGDADVIARQTLAAAGLAVPTLETGK